MGLAARRQQAAVTFIAITVVIDVLGFGIVIPVLPKLVQQFMGDDPVRLNGAIWARCHDAIVFGALAFQGNFPRLRPACVFRPEEGLCLYARYDSAMGLM